VTEKEKMVLMPRIRV